MKTIRFFAIAAMAAMTLLASCGKENETAATGDNVIGIRLPDNVVTRAVGDMQTTSTVISLDAVTVFLLNGNSVVGTPYTFDPTELTAKYKRIEQVPSSVNGVYVVANLPSTGTEATDVAALTSVGALNGYAYSIAGQNTATGIIAQTLIGQAAAAPASDPDLGHDPTHTYKEANVTLDAMTARFEIGAVKPGTGLVSVELVGVWMNAFYTNSTKAAIQTYASNDVCWNVTPATSTASSVDLTVLPTGITAYGCPSFYDFADNTNVFVGAGSKVYGYQLFAGGDVPHLILLVKGEYAPGYYEGSDKYFLGYVTFTKFLEGGTPITSVLANTIYKVGVGATGIEITPDIITPDPELEDFDLGVNVTLTPWTEKTVTPGV